MMDANYFETDNPNPIAWTTGEPLFTAEQKMRMEAVKMAVELYSGKTATHLDSYNESFKKLYTEIYNFYVNNKELH